MDWAVDLYLMGYLLANIADMFAAHSFYLHNPTLPHRMYDEHCHIRITRSLWFTLPTTDLGM